MKENRKNVQIILFAVVCLFLGQNSFAETQDSGPGFGPVKEVKLDSLSEDLAKKGKETFTAKCSSCHKMDERYVGPALGDVFKRRRPEWIMNMILNPAEMIEKDEAVKELFGEYLIPMPFQNVNNDETRSILEYFRYYSEKGEIKEAKAPAAKSKKK